MGERPIILGTGLVALDEVQDVDAAASIRAAGGTCANVLANLAALGWASFPVARLKNDPAGKLVAADLEDAGVDTTLLRLSPQRPTPIVLQVNRRSATGEVSHRFLLRCPTCGGHLPRYTPVILSAVETVLSAVPNPNVFFFDRPSAAALRLAKSYSERGALVVFEPSGGFSSPHLRSAVGLADILKYSHDRIDRLELPPANERRLVLEIQTLGARGLRYRRFKARSRSWTHVDAFTTRRLIDTAGCGDWTTAGILNKLGVLSREALRVAGEDVLNEAVREGQAFAVWSAGFPGARGGNVARTPQQRDEEVAFILSEGRQPKTSKPRANKRRGQTDQVCMQCTP